MANRTTLITDFDNTLYDWFHMWHASFSAMLKEIVRISGFDEGVLLPEIRAIHQKNRTSEYAFLLQEIPSLRKAFPEDDLLLLFDDAIHAYRRARKASLELYDGVKETLAELRSKDVLIVIYTESLAYYTNYRIRRLGLDELVDLVYSPPDHSLPNVIGHGADQAARLSHAKHSYVPVGVIKPDPKVLSDIFRDIGRPPTECVYVGDSKMKDIAMAQAASVTDVLAEYGGVINPDYYGLLQKVSHWTDADVSREHSTPVTPTHTIKHFKEILQFFI